jgi:hypothetical protein
VARRTRTIRAVAAAAFLVLAFPASGEDAGGRPPAASGGKGAYTLGEVQIRGSAEQPAVLFFLPKAGFALLPYRPEAAWKDSLVADDRSAYGE